MDTISHVSMGVAVGLFATSVATKQDLTSAGANVMICSVIANLIPDIDVVLKLKSNASYISNHRGKTHSLVVAIIWILLLTLVGTKTSSDGWLIYLLVSASGVLLHLGTDYLNGYGIQLLWPFHKKWIALGITHTIDTVIIATHAIAFILVITFNYNASIVMPILFITILIYLLISFAYQLHIKLVLIKKYGKYKRMIVQAKSTPRTWKYIYETYDKVFYIGIFEKNTITELKVEKRLESVTPELEAKLMHDKKFRTFIEFTPIYNYTITELGDGLTEIRYYDLRYLVIKKGKLMYQFYCALQIKDDKLLKSYLGFIMNEDVIEKKLKKLNV